VGEVDVGGVEAGDFVSPRLGRGFQRAGALGYIS
jgi:hypothetical protein